ncbi:MAG: restriction endonuclease subunit S [Atopobiaceae bacterium]|nr:restriction endonuclease subunit S [Atopobiaceae bacterium]
MSWKAAPLGELADVQLGKMLDQKKNQGEYRRYLGNDNVRWNKFKFDEVKEMRIKDSERVRYGLRRGDLLICEGGDPGRCALWMSDEEMYYQKALNRVRVRGDIDPRYLLYYFLHIGATREVAQYYTGGATIKHLPNAALKRVEVRYPELETQRRIASVLMAYDNLIENNRRQIALLEEAAQRLYKEWFVDLRFPGYESAVIVDGVPEDWQRISIEELGTYLNGYAFKPTDHFSEGLPILKIKELRGGITSDTPRNSGAEIPDKYRVHRGDIVFSWSATLAVDVWDDEDSLLNQHLFKVTPRRQETHEYVVQSLSNLIKEMYAMTTGSTMTHLQRNKLKVIKTLLPSDDILAEYNVVAAPLRKQITSLKRRNGYACEARDRLLPKLMSGEIEM